jgi:hypothetical protein
MSSVTGRLLGLARTIEFTAMFATVDLLDVELVEELPDAIRVSVLTRSGTRREIIVPRDEIHEQTLKKGTVGTVTVFRDWARREGFL